MLTKPYPQIEEWLRSHTIEEINAICSELKLTTKTTAC